MNIPVVELALLNSLAHYEAQTTEPTSFHHYSLVYLSGQVDTQEQLLFNYLEERMKKPKISC